MIFREVKNYYNIKINIIRNFIKSFSDKFFNMYERVKNSYKKIPINVDVE